MTAFPLDQPRIMGSEIEYSVNPLLKDELIENSKVDRALNDIGISNFDFFLGNGGRLYPDMYTVLEYATPECSTLDELVIHEMAGEELVQAVAKNIWGNSKQLIKRSNDAIGNAKGAHENYLIENRENFNIRFNKQELASHLVTRIIFTGSGQIMTNRYGDDEPVFTLDQRSWSHGGDILDDNATITPKPLILDRNQPHADENYWQRLQIVSGDANLSPWAIKMKFGTTSLVLRMLEHGLYPDNCILLDPVEAFNQISSDLTFKKKFATTEHTKRTRSALEIQRRLADVALKINKNNDLPPDESWVANEWAETCDALAHEPDVLGNKIEWVAKRKMFDDYTNYKDCELDDIKVRYADFKWHFLGSNEKPTTGKGNLKGLVQRMRENGDFDAMPTRKSINKAKTKAPTTTRAHIRGYRIRLKEDIFSVDWAYLKNKKGPDLNLSDPYQVNL